MTISKRTDVKVFLAYDGGWDDVSAYVKRVNVSMGDVTRVGTFSGGADNVVRDAQVVFHPNIDQKYLEMYTEVWIEQAVVESNVVPSSNDYVPLFSGFFGDDVHIDTMEITCAARDKAMVLQDCYILDPHIFPTTEQDERVDTVIEQVLDLMNQPPEQEDGQSPVDLPSGDFSLVVEDTPVDDNGHELMVRYYDEDDEKAPFGIQDETLWSFLQSIATQIGWFLGFRLPADRDDVFQLTLLKPPVDKTSIDHDLTGSEDVVVGASAQTSIEHVRNFVRIEWTEESYNVEERFLTEFDQESIDKYLLRPMAIARHNCDMLSSEIEARNLAAWAMHDLSEPQRQTQLQTFSLPGVDLFDRIKYTHPILGDQEGSVQSIEHSIEFGERPSFRTTIVISDRVVGGGGRWSMMEKRPETGGATDEGELDTTLPPPIPTNVVPAKDDLGVFVEWSTRAFATRIRVAKSSESFEPIDPNADWNDYSWDFSRTVTGDAFHYPHIGVGEYIIYQLRAETVSNRFSAWSAPEQFYLAAPGSVGDLQTSETWRQLKDGTWIEQIHADWEKQSTSGLIRRQGASVYYRKDEGDWVFAERVMYSPLSAASRAEATFDVEGPGHYTVKVVSMGGLRYDQEFESAQEDTIEVKGKMEYSEVIEFTKAVWKKDRIVLEWTSAEDADFESYEIRLDDKFCAECVEALRFKGKVWHKE